MNIAFGIFIPKCGSNHTRQPEGRVYSQRIRCQVLLVDEVERNSTFDKRVRADAVNPVRFPIVYRLTLGVALEPVRPFFQYFSVSPVYFNTRNHFDAFFLQGFGILSIRIPAF